jgi:hypothetical protein
VTVGVVAQVSDLPVAMKNVGIGTGLIQHGILVRGRIGDVEATRVRAAQIL